MHECMFGGKARDAHMRVAMGVCDITMATIALAQKWRMQGSVRISCFGHVTASADDSVFHSS